jgi:AraC-like DNA-binding protein
MGRNVFTPDNPVLPMNYPSFVFRTLRDDGFQAEALLAGTGLKESALYDPHFRCGFQQLRQFFLNAIEQTRDPDLGVKLALKFQHTNIGLPAYIAMSAASFEDAIHVLQQFFSLNFPAFELCLLNEQPGLKAEESAIRLRARFPFEELEYFGFGSAIIAINGLLKAVLQADQVATRAEMTIRQPQDWSVTEIELGFPFRFEATENSLVFPKALLSRTLPGADPLNHALLLRICERFMAEMPLLKTPVTQVVAILEASPCLTLSFSNVAAELGYSERSLRRLLDRSGTSYRKLLDQVLEQRARTLLAGKMLPIKTIAATLGFDSSSNFARSFKRWTGLSPKLFREKAAYQDRTDPE